MSIVGMFMVHKREQNKKTNRWNAAICKAVETFFADWSKSKCEHWFNLLSVVFSIVWAVVGIVVSGLSFWLAFCIIIVVIGLHALSCCSLLHAIKGKEQEKNLLLEQTQNKLKDETAQHLETKQKLADLQLMFDRSTARHIEIGLFSKHIETANGKRNAKKIYTQLANSVSHLVSAYTKLNREYFSVSIYMYDGEDGLVRRVEVDSAVPTIQAPHEGEVNKIEDKKNYYYAKCIRDKRKTFSLSSRDEIEKAFYPPIEKGADYSHLSQYAAMSYDLGNKLKLYIEVIAYDGGRFGDNLEDFISYAIAPFATSVANLDWKTIRGGQ